MSDIYSKGPHIRDLFNTIAPHYDLINALTSFGRHHYWSRALIEFSGVSQGATALDVCCGTGMITLRLAEKVGLRGKVVGIDFSEEMLRIARKKAGKSKFRSTIELIEANALKLPFADNTFDCAVIAYGLRNVADLKQALLEIQRVIKPGGRLASLELAHPYLPIFKQLYYLYLGHWIPFIGQLLTGNKPAYQYLDESIRNYPNQHKITEIFGKLGFLNPQCYELTFGIASIHIGTKPS